jgi:hypothetical protein
MRAALDKFMQALAEQMRNNPVRLNPIEVILRKQIELHERTSREGESGALDELSRDEDALRQELKNLLDRSRR